MRNAINDQYFPQIRTSQSIRFVNQLSVFYMKGIFVVYKVRKRPFWKSFAAIFLYSFKFFMGLHRVINYLLVTCGSIVTVHA